MLNSSIISLIVLRYNMGRKYKGPRLYWRILRNGKYTWKKATYANTGLMGDYDPELAFYMGEDES